MDEQGLGRLLDHVLPHIQGLFLASPLGGEGEKLDAERREELLRKVIPSIRGKLPLFVWVTQSTERSTLETILLLEQSLESSRYSGRVYWVDTPLYYLSNRGLARYYQDVASRFTRGWLLHNDPHLIQKLGRPFKRNNIRTNILKALCGVKNLEGLIFSGSLERAYNYQKAVRSNPDFKIYDGEESRFLSHPSLSGVISLGANLAPKAWQRITRSTLNLDAIGEDYPDRLQQIWETGLQLQEFMNLYTQAPSIVLKQALFRMGLLNSPFSLRGEADADEVQDLMNWIRNHDRLWL